MSKKKKQSELYMLVRKGLVQRMPMMMKGKTVLCWPVAETHEDALRLCRETGKSDVRPSLIGSAPGETLENLQELAIQEGCEFLVWPTGWDKTGEPVWGACPLTE